ncbi:unnamed protein product [Brassica napus]|uniref:Uncharacterized protein n=3 Tax=Brassica TaxID=3705 RepID=A0A0D3CSJ7_BRAOL|nr:unnamed protein product [Brassica napus]VDD61414.1 unnamed protein product [Brassica oleracea]
MQSTQQSGKKYKSILNIVDEKSYGLLDSPLRWMAYLLNPYYFYKDMSIQFDQDVITATFKCVDAFYPNDLDARTFFINTELAMYAKKREILGIQQPAIKGCSKNDENYDLDSATHAQDWIVEETDVELGDTCETLGTSSRDDLMREFDESDFESDDEEKIDMEFDLDDE